MACKILTLEKAHPPAYAFTLLFLLLSIPHSSLAIYDIARYCHLVPIGTKFPSFESCQLYYTCQRDGYTEHSCNFKESFDKDSQSCKPSSMVSCYSALHNPCSQSDANFVENPTNCKGFVSCRNRKELGRGNCPYGQIFDGQRQECKYGTCQNLVGPSAKGDLEDLCRIMQVNHYFGDFKRCETWRICATGGELLVEGNCAKDLVFDVQTRMCLREYGQMCARLRLPSDSCAASNQGVLKGDRYTCSDYYRCEDKLWLKLSCPLGEYFDVVRNVCVVRQLATPLATCDRCQYAKVRWVNAVDPQCMHYHECYEGRQLRDGSCNPGAYFREDRQICIKGASDLDRYKKQNGACKEVDSTTESPGQSTSATTNPTTTPGTTASTSQSTSTGPVDSSVTTSSSSQESTTNAITSPVTSTSDVPETTQASTVTDVITKPVTSTSDDPETTQSSTISSTITSSTLEPTTSSETPSTTETAPNTSTSSSTATTEDSTTDEISTTLISSSSSTTSTSSATISTSSTTTSSTAVPTSSSSSSTSSTSSSTTSSTSDPTSSSTASSPSASTSSSTTSSTSTPTSSSTTSSTSSPNITATNILSTSSTTISTTSSPSSSPTSSTPTTSNASSPTSASSTSTVSYPPSSTQAKCQPSERGTYKGDTLICSQYYLCDGTYWISHSCSNPHYFNIVSLQCENRQLATPASQCDRCQYSATTWVNAVDPHCSKYLICRNGHQVAQSTCGSKSFFDEKRQACVIGASSFQEYQKQNGACRKDA